jgi:hypothetical protein
MTTTTNPPPKHLKNQHSTVSLVLARRLDDRSLANRYRIYLAAPKRAELELPITDPFLAGLRSQPVRDVCLLAGAHRRLKQVDGRNIGAVLRTLVDRRELSTGSAETRLLALSRQPWTAAATTLRSILAQAESAGTGVDWHDLAWAAHNWKTARHAQDISRWARSFQPVSTEPSETKSDQPTEQGK